MSAVRRYIVQFWVIRGFVYVPYVPTYVLVVVNIKEWFNLVTFFDEQAD